MVAMHQDAKFQGVNQEFHAFQSVLGEVVEDLAAYSDNKQSKFKRIFIKRIFFGQMKPQKAPKPHRS